MQYYRVDESGKPIEILVDNEDKDPTIIPGWGPETSLFDPTYDFVNKIWTEGMNQEQIDLIRNRPREPTEMDLLNERVDNSEFAIISLMDFM